ncbi:MAG TPA: T9SS type A sorting domain-containing protein [Mariniphaga anaerophila]|uniref:T9SS type A sorting domain-containing protein n=1 Tax=Mariniphaga anaerophila TaxID=1484053 RepID=A0A831PKL0_9BACT|nr:T9SS type A sorting domain-containing protein [Mariniphaga anaerophila]
MQTHDNRETQYIVSGKTTKSTTLDVANNDSQIAVVSNIKPSNDGIITVVASPGTNNNNSVQYFYLGVIQVDYQEDSLTEANNAPFSNAGNNQTVNEGDFVMLDGSGSFDPDDDVITYFWTAPEGIVLSANDVAQPTFTAPQVDEDTQYVFTLVVNDGILDSEQDNVVATVNDSITTEISNRFVNTKHKQIKVYPNPNNGSFTLELKNFNRQAEITIMNLSGKVVYRIENNERSHFELNSPYLQRGIYNISVSDGLSIKTRKMIVNH